MAKSEPGKYRFKRLKVQVFTIVDSNKKEFGSVRIEPDAVSWKPAGTSQWHRLTMKEFGNLAVQHGSKGES
jgi:hypothetical protein